MTIMPRVRNASIGLALLAAFAGCASVRVVRRNQTGGVLALKGERGEALEKARQLMLEHCRGPYTVIEEGEYVVGQETRVGQETYQTRDGSVVTESGESTQQVTEWRVTYQCGEAAPPAGPPSADPQGDFPPPPPQY